MRTCSNCDRLEGGGTSPLCGCKRLAGVLYQFVRSSLAYAHDVDAASTAVEDGFTRC